MSRINVLDPPEVIRNKIKRCKTDAVVGLEWNNPDRPEATNLLNIYAAVQPHRSRQDIENEVKDMAWGEFKPVLAEAIVDHLRPIQDRYHQVRNDPEHLAQVLAQGARAADAVASQKLRAARVAMGFATPAAK
jgi:tryptophanyl-tRNA synthetase